MHSTKKVRKTVVLLDAICHVLDRFGSFCVILGRNGWFWLVLAGYGSFWLVLGDSIVY